MDYYLIKGHFYVLGQSPDGDSVKFKADNPKHWEKINSAAKDEFLEVLNNPYKSGRKKKADKEMHAVQLRLQGVDALETHYCPPGRRMPNYSQPEEYADLATDRLLEILGVSTASWNKKAGRRSNIMSITLGAGQQATELRVLKGEAYTEVLPGYVVVNDFDPRGRPLAWAFAGKTRRRNGGKVSPSSLKSLLPKSINYQLLAEGLVYPYFFSTLQKSLRAVLQQGAEKASQKKLNIWSKDRTMSGVTTDNVSDITQKYLLQPHYFRKIIRFIHQSKTLNGQLDLSTLYDGQNPYLFLIKEADFKRTDEIVVVTKNRIRLTAHPSNIVFLDYSKPPK
jgi:endonuclease YncB( thermonuclease family)